MSGLKKKERGGQNGYTLVELMVVITIMAILASVSAGVYTGYIKKAEMSGLYDTAHQIIQALEICEAENADGADTSGRYYWTDAYLKPPNHPDSILYPYVGDMTKDCTGYSLKIGKKEDRYRVVGFTYETDQYVVRWNRTSGITVEEK